MSPNNNWAKRRRKNDAQVCKFNNDTNPIIFQESLTPGHGNEVSFVYMHHHC